MAATPDIERISSFFEFSGVFKRADPYGSGHINDTYLCISEQEGRVERHIIQRINHHIFTDPLTMMNNGVRVAEHLRQKLIAEQATDLDRRSLRFVRTKSGTIGHLDDDGRYWRAMRFIPNAQTHEFASTPKHTFEAAIAFGRFQSQLLDLPPESLPPVIPFFHHTPKRLDALIAAIANDAENRVASARRTIDFALHRQPLCAELQTRLERGELPLRVTHNDAKIDNVLIDTTRCEGLCVVDLDTVGAGLVHFDFGDLLRTAVFAAGEAEQAIDSIHIDMEMARAAVAGYLTGAKGFLQPSELDTLAISGKLLALETGIRFLTDHLDGDRYFKTAYRDQNLQRARSQFRRVELLEQHEDELVRLIRTHC